MRWTASSRVAIACASSESSRPPRPPRSLQATSHRASIAGPADVLEVLSPSLPALLSFLRPMSTSHVGTSTSDAHICARYHEKVAATPDFAHGPHVPLSARLFTSAAVLLCHFHWRTVYSHPQNLPRAPASSTPIGRRLSSRLIGWRVRHAPVIIRTNVGMALPEMVQLPWRVTSQKDDELPMFHCRLRRRPLLATE
ncbi:hypothetical protein OH76DRAFT_1041794 [Lentinus brumalis]|uniref:Uncharacterized protein n=1 Tax=Lentinus brumalis TaxID=2498619 RepID=A0A371CX34_9APHY|nr:hypothetical protein OH76DRAFT_1041794 [Polyporus brumalis]